MKGKSALVLVILFLALVGFGFLVYYGAGTSKIFSLANIKQGLDLKGGVSILYEADAESPTVEQMDAATAVIQGRLDNFGYTEAEVAIEGGKRIRVDIPGVENAEEAITQIGATAMLMFAEETAATTEPLASITPIIDGGSSSDINIVVEQPTVEVVNPADTTAVAPATDGTTAETPAADGAATPAPAADGTETAAPAADGTVTVAPADGTAAADPAEAALGLNIILTGEMVERAQAMVQTQQQGSLPEYVVTLDFTPEGRAIFEEATGRNIGKPIYIMMDNQMLSAPTVNERITGGNAIITGGFTQQEAKNLADMIQGGALPFSLNVIYFNNVGAKLGVDALSSSMLAGAIGICLVVLFMLFIYKFLGVTADLALIIYIELMFLCLSLFGVTLTLPGIAGIILSVGMAVDANVIIFERIREELALGKTLRASIDAGFKRAFPAILDGNVTTLIAAAVLFGMGSGPVRGFAQTLSIGVILSMFTALVITRFVLNAFVHIGVNNPNLYSSKRKAGANS
ncbi:MAG: protein translocase subunit SecD [Clostridiales bacterium]|jgi:protein-export membrane protein SecD|nr:protein translocase subunit SecD [Clostridiales bacterium]